MKADARLSEVPAIPTDLRPRDYQRLSRELAALDGSGLEPLRLAILAGSTLDFLRPVLVVEGARAGFAVDLFLGEFGQLEQPLLDEGSSLHRSPRDVLVLLFQPTDIVPGSFDRFYATGGTALDVLCSELIERLVQAASTFRTQTGRPTLIANFAIPAALPLGPFDAGDPTGLTHRLAAQNAKLAERVRAEPDIYVWDYAGLVREAGSAAWSDPRMRYLARVAVAPASQPVMARHLVRTATALRRRPAKCLVLDLDNTLWGGVVGDDGREGLQLGDDWPGSPFKAFQSVVLGLRDRGILIALASKNDEDAAEDVFRNHPEMLIGWDDLAAVKVNWEPKSTNLISIADELNIGVDALALFDDNPVERAEVRASLPEARVIEVPTDPARYCEALLSCGHFDQLSLSSEDRERAEMYRVERKRVALRRDAPNLEDFLVGLDMEGEVARAGPDTLARIAQLVAKTNQFNLTTRRHPPAELATMSQADDTVVAWLRLKDRFGDQGLCAVGILQQRGNDAFLDTFLMSCRVMNRGVEHAMMAYLAEHGATLGCANLIGEYRPTAKNHIVQTLFQGLGFEPHGQSEGGTLWRMSLPADRALWPSHIRRLDPTRAALQGTLA